MLTTNFFQQLFGKYKDFVVQLDSNEAVFTINAHNPSESLKVNEYTHYFQVKLQKSSDSFFQIPKRNISSYGMGSPYNYKSFDDYREIVGYIRFENDAEFLFLSYDNM
ncbi:hypothetical protein [Paenibacillus tengchongensis]|uniref:hypothetical protein n=1 Tax=Paenibacillus tengchongensis TaxID=2608684 RepID=UPI00124D7337|nr:hypothetical protein [Paenibacillus tengchongensis]